jgi:hypothetical protein
MPKLIISPEHRYYHVNDNQNVLREFIGTTTLIQLEGGAQGLEWVDSWYLERGSAVHAATAMYDLGTLDEDSVDVRIKGYLDSWKRYRDAEKSTYTAEQVEVMLCDTTYGFAGTIDRLAGLVDLKCGAPKKADLAQLGAYYCLCQANKIDKDWYMGSNSRRVIYLNEDGSYPNVKQYTLREIMAAKESFLAALTWHNFKNTK